MQVFKFGGASVKDANAVKNVSAIIKKFVHSPTVVVVSAMGKTTNQLERLVRAYFNKDSDTTVILEEIKNYHLQITRELFSDERDAVYEDLNNVFVELLWAVEEEPSFPFDHHYDQIVSLGEILATRIISAYLYENAVTNKWVDARGIIQTDNNYRNGNVDYALSDALVKTQLLTILKNTPLVITQGFIGGTSENFTTTLGREGSDYTAALLAYFCDAEKVVIWKDVPGVLNADPKYFKNTKKLDEISYHDAIELTYYGASVIHPKTIKPLQNKNIPLYVRSFVDPDSEGTVISEETARHSEASYIFKDDQILISILPKDFSFIAEDNLSKIFAHLRDLGIRTNMMQNSALSFSICIDHDEYRTRQLIDDLSEQYTVLFNENVQLMTIRNYTVETLAWLSEGREILLEQRTRNTHQMVLKAKG